jgi:hypothetical protein
MTTDSQRKEEPQPVSARRGRVLSCTAPAEIDPSANYWPRSRSRWPQ